MNRMMGVTALVVAAALAVPVLAADMGQTSPTADANQTTDNNTMTTTDNTMNNSQHGQLTSSERDFADKASQGNMMEVEAGKLAQANGQSQRVKDFGKQLETDHSKAQQNLKQVMQADNATPPAKLDSAHQDKVSKVKNLPAASFDRQFIDMMVTDHQNDIKEYQQEEAKATDPQLKSYISMTLPTLRQHLQTAQQIQKNLGAEAKE